MKSAKEYARDWKPGLGKFEGSPPECGWFYDASGNGDGEILCGQEEDGHYAAAFTVDDEEAAAFDLTHSETVVLVEDTNGFCALIPMETWIVGWSPEERKADLAEWYGVTL